MSDVENETSNEKYVSEINPAFAEAWNDIYAPEDAEAPDESTGTDGPNSEGAATSAASGEGAGGADEESAASAPRDDADVAREVLGAAPGEESDGGRRPVADPAKTSGAGFDLSEDRLSEVFGTASKQIDERMDEAFRRSALAELQENVDEKYFEALKMHPMQLVGETVPGLKPGAQDMVIKDSQQAREWQEVIDKLLTEELNDIAKGKAEELRPTMSVVQDSVLLFQNNPDLIPGSAKFNKALADRVADAAKAYEYKAGGKLLGYSVNIQPLINALRETTKSAGAPATGASTEQKREQAAGQSRDQEGRFDAPQAGIRSRGGVASGGAEEDYGAFWSATQFRGEPNLPL